MKIQRQHLTDERYGIKDEGEFKIKTSPELFSLLSDGLYTDKTLAVVRELSCNAWDAQKEVGNESKPFDVHLPNQIEPWFSIRDYGTGLSHRDVLELYSTYGESTKNNSNDFIGALGVGSKSPFAYSDSFTVTSFFNGERRSYSAFLSGEGIPSIAMMGEPIQTDQPNGLEVLVPVLTKDFGEFFSKAARIYSRFDVVPNVTGGIEPFEIPKTKYILESKTWRIKHRVAYEKAYAIQGKIAYPIDIRSMGDIPNEAAVILNRSIDIDFEIGSLDISASREGLGYKPRTIKALVDRALEIRTELTERVQDKLSNCKNLYEARLLYATWRQKNFLIQLDINPKYEGVEVSDVIQFGNGFTQFKGFGFFLPEIKRGRLHKEEKNGRFMLPSIDGKSPVLFEIDPGCTYPWERIKEFLKKEDKFVIVIESDGSPEGKNNRAEFLKVLGAPGSTFKKVSKLPRPTKTQKTESTRVWKREFNIRYQDESRAWDRTEFGLEHGGFYVELKNKKPVFKGKPFYTPYNRRRYGYKSDDLTTLASKLKSLKILPDNFELFGIRSVDLEGLDKTKWTNFFEFAEEQIEKKLNDKELVEMVLNRRGRQKMKFLSWFSFLERQKTEIKLQEFHEFADALTHANEIGISDVEESLIEVSRMLKIISSVLDGKGKSKVEIAWDKFVGKAPMMDMVNSNFNADVLIEYLNMCSEKS